MCLDSVVQVQVTTTWKFGNTQGSEGLNLTGPGQAAQTARVTLLHNAWATQLHIFIIPSKHLELVGIKESAAILLFE